MRNVVVDTNVLVRAFLNRNNSDGRVFAKAITGEIQLWYSRRLLEELLRVLSYPRLARYTITREAIDAFIKMLMLHGKSIQPQSTTLCRDPDDNEILGIALALVGSEPVYLISADKDLLALRNRIEGVTILTPQEFLKGMPVGAKIR